MSSAFRVFRVLVLFAICLKAEPVHVSKGAAAAVEHSVGKHILLEGIPNFGEVTPTLYRGGQPTEEGFNRLAKMGVNIVVDTGMSKTDKKLISKLGMDYVSFPWHCPFPRDEVFARFLKLIKENPGKKIFVHCRFGDDRTGMMIAAFRMGGQGWTAEQAMTEMHAFGFTAAHRVICPGLAGYEKSSHCPAHPAAGPAGTPAAPAADAGSTAAATATLNWPQSLKRIGLLFPEGANGAKGSLPM